VAGLLLSLALAFALGRPARAADTGRVPKSVGQVLERLKRDVSPEKLRHLDSAGAEAALSDRERQVLSTAHLVFKSRVPVIVSVFCESGTGHEPFWLKGRGFQPAKMTVSVGNKSFVAWERVFGAGPVGLGVNSLAGGGTHYFVAVRPSGGSGPAVVSGLRPDSLRTGLLTEGTRPFVDRDDVLGSVPLEYQGCVLIRTEHGRRDDGKLVGRLRFTDYPSGRCPDNILLTWEGDPRSTVTVQWRTWAPTTHGYVEYRKVSDPESTVQRAGARRQGQRTPDLLNDPAIGWYTATLAGLDPGTTYAYWVGDGTPEGTSRPATFTTAPSGPAAFAFVYLGDAQVGFDRWGLLVSNTFRAQPDAAFVTIAGDLVNRGANREEWDSLFHHGKGVLNQRPLAPVLGNHDCAGGSPGLYLDFFALPHNGPATVPAERVYSFEYGSALFVMLDSNLPAEAQKQWLGRTLSRSQARWKFVSFHHPVYSSALTRDNKKLRQAWMPLFDRYGVDLVLQGHDHAYLRTHPLKNERRVGAGERGTVYVVSMSGTKSYLQMPHTYTAVGFTNVPTAQVIQVDAEGHRLEYRALDAAGRIRDQFAIVK
jgi:hypothetical protein